MGLLVIQARKCFAVLRYVEHALLQEITSAPVWSRSKVPAPLSTGTKNIQCCKQDKKIIFPEILIFLYSLRVHRLN